MHCCTRQVQGILPVFHSLYHKSKAYCLYFIHYTIRPRHIACISFIIPHVQGILPVFHSLYYKSKAYCLYFIHHTTRPRHIACISFIIPHIQGIFPDTLGCKLCVIDTSLCLYLLHLDNNYYSIFSSIVSCY
jgi:hypothetical protein